MKKSASEMRTAFGTTTLAILLLVCPHGTNSWAKQGEEVRIVEPTAFSPLQEEVGKEEVAEKADEYEQSAESLAPKKSGMKAFKNALIDQINNDASVGVESVIDPEGTFRPTDRHHTLDATKSLIEKYDLDPEKIKWRVKIKKGDDFSKGPGSQQEKWEKFAVEMKRRGYFFFSDKTLIKYGIKNWDRVTNPKLLAEVYQNHLPKTFDDILDSPMRSALGRQFDNLGIKGSAFVPGVQLKLGDLYKKYGVSVPKGEAFSDPVQAEMNRLLLQSEHSQELISALKGWALPKRSQEISEKLATKKAEYGKLIQGLSQSNNPVDDEDVHVSAVSCFTASLAVQTGQRAFPKIVQMATQPMLAGLVESAQTQTVRAVDPDSLEGILKPLTQKSTDLSKLDGTEVKALKEMRKKVLVLRAARRLFTSGPVPPDLANFTRDFGELNDDIKRYQKGIGSEKKVRADAREVKEILDRNPALFKSNYTVASEEEFIRAQKKMVRKIDDLLAKDVPEHRKRQKLTVAEYHDIRKIIRDFREEFELMKEKTGDRNTYQIAARLDVLSGAMGRVKDGYIIGKKAVAEPEKAITVIDDTHRKLLEEFVQLMDRSLPRN